MKFLAILLLALYSVSICAQNPQVPEDYDFSTKIYCESYEDEIIEFIQWLYENPIGEEQEIRNRINAFIHEWGKESPTLLLFPISKISNPIFKELKKKELDIVYKRELFMSYYNGMVEYLISHPSEEHLENVIYAGITKVLHMAEQNPEYKSSTAVNKYKRLYEENELDAWIEKKLTTRERTSYKDFQEGRVSKDDYPEGSYPFRI